MVDTRGSSDGRCTVNFDFNDPKDIERSFDSIRVPLEQYFPYGVNYGQKGQTPYHVELLEELKEQLNVTQGEFESAVQLAEGYRRLLVVLLEPSDMEEVPYDDVSEASSTIVKIHDLLQDASDGRLGVDETCIYDVRPLRPRWRREEDFEGDDVEREKDELAYTCFENMVKKQKPDVVVICQCQRSGVTNETAKILCSEMARAGETAERTIGGRRVRVLYGFHPSMVSNENYLKEHIKAFQLDVQDLQLFGNFVHDLLRLSFHIAINALAGRMVSGDGIAKLRYRVLGPRGITSRDGRQDLASEAVRRAMANVRVGGAKGTGPGL